MIIVDLLCGFVWEGLELGAFGILLLQGLFETIGAHSRDLSLLLLVLNLVQECVLDDLGVDLLMEADLLCRFADPRRLAPVCVGGRKRFRHLQVVVHVKTTFCDVPAIFLGLLLGGPSSLADLKLCVDLGLRSAVFCEQPGYFRASAEGVHGGGVNGMGPYFRIIHPVSPDNKIIERNVPI